MHPDLEIGLKALDDELYAARHHLNQFVTHRNTGARTAELNAQRETLMAIDRAIGLVSQLREVAV